MSEELVREIESFFDKYESILVAAFTCARSRTCVKILKLLAESPKPLYTREIFYKLAGIDRGIREPGSGVSWGKAGRVGKDPEATLKILERYGLIRRYEEECIIPSRKKPGLKVKTKCKYNQITTIGRIAYRIIAKLEELGLIEI